MFNLLTVCKFCKKRRLYVNYRKYVIPRIGIRTISVEKMCGKCFERLTKKLK